VPQYGVLPVDDNMPGRLESIGRSGLIINLLNKMCRATNSQLTTMISIAIIASEPTALTLQCGHPHLSNALYVRLVPRFLEVPRRFLSGIGRRDRPTLLIGTVFTADPTVQWALDASR
jgi:hypothetical protein